MQRKSLSNISGFFGFVFTGILVFLLSTTPAWPTAQFPDYLLYKGKQHEIFSNPLEMYFNDENPEPEGLFRSVCSGCWRGYVATWEIREKGLYLVKLMEGTCDPDALEIPLSKIFPGKSGPIEAKWFSGVIRIPMGRQLKYVHMGYGSIFEKVRRLTFEKGVLVKEEMIDNTTKESHPKWKPSQDELDSLKRHQDQWGK